MYTVTYYSMSLQELVYFVLHLVPYSDPSAVLPRKEDGGLLIGDAAELPGGNGGGSLIGDAAVDGGVQSPGGSARRMLVTTAFVSLSVVAAFSICCDMTFDTASITSTPVTPPATSPVTSPNTDSKVTWFKVEVRTYETEHTAARAKQAAQSGTFETEVRTCPVRLRALRDHVTT